MKYQKLTAKQILSHFPELVNFFASQEIKGNNKLIVSAYIGGKVEIRPSLYDYTVRYLFLKNNDVEREVYAGCSDNLQDVFAWNGVNYGELPKNGLVAVLDNHGQGSKYLTVFLGHEDSRLLNN